MKLPSHSSPTSSQIIWRGHGFRMVILRPSDATAGVASWFADESNMAALNMPARNLTVDQLRQHIATYDQKSRMINLILEEGVMLRAIGIYIFDINAEHRILTLSGFNGAKPASGSAFFKFCRGMLHHLLTNASIGKIRCQVATTNKKALASCWLMGLKQEGLLRQEIMHFKTGERLDQYSFGLLEGDLRKN